MSQYLSVDLYVYDNMFMCTSLCFCLSLSVYVSMHTKKENEQKTITGQRVGESERARERQGRDSGKRERKTNAAPTKNTPTPQQYHKQQGHTTVTNRRRKNVGVEIDGRCVSFFRMHADVSVLTVCC